MPHKPKRIWLPIPEDVLCVQGNSKPESWSERKSWRKDYVPSPEVVEHRKADLYLEHHHLVLNLTRLMASNTARKLIEKALAQYEEEYEKEAVRKLEESFMAI